MKNLKFLRKNSKISQVELAKKLKVSQETISKWENGKVVPDVKNLIAMSTIFNSSIDYLLDLPPKVTGLSQYSPQQQKVIALILQLSEDNLYKLEERASMLYEMQLSK